VDAPPRVREDPTPGGRDGARDVREGAMAPKLDFAPRTFPSRIADLGFTVALPADWVTHPLPPEEPDFSNPTQFAALAVVTAPHAAIVFAFAARPAYDNGTLHDWARYLLRENGLTPRTAGEGRLGSLPAVIGEATQDSDLGPMVIRFAFAEDGGRLLNVTLSAPELLADAVLPAWPAALESFALDTPRGPRAAASPEAAPSAAASKSSSGEGFAAHALAADHATLGPDHPVNVNLRERGAGLTPNLVAADDEARCATVAAGAITAAFGVPYGWYVIDDGRRTLVFEPSGEIQIHLNLTVREGRDDEALLDGIEEEARRSYPEPQFLRLTEGKIRALAMRNIQDGGQPIEQVHMLVAGPDEGVVLRARVTATPERITAACNLAQLVVESARFGG
jgi:hypothetical protein